MEYRLNETDNFEARNIPWVKAGSPSPLMINTDLVLEGSTKVLRCRAMGFPKPYLSWVSLFEYSRWADRLHTEELVYFFPVNVLLFAHF